MTSLRLFLAGLVISAACESPDPDGLIDAFLRGLGPFGWGRLVEDWVWDTGVEGWEVCLRSSRAWGACEAVDRRLQPSGWMSLPRW